MSGDRLSPAQLGLLRRIAATNGGGYPALPRDHRLLDALARRQLIQAQSGRQARVIHTRAGLDLIRRIDSKGRP